MAFVPMAQEHLGYVTFQLTSLAQREQSSLSNDLSGALIIGDFAFQILCCSVNVMR